MHKAIKQIVGLIVCIAVYLAVLPTAQARNDKYLLPIKSAMETTDVREKPDGSVKFFFGKQEFPKATTNLGSDSTHQRARTRRGEDEKACNAAFLSALVALQKRAQKLGANAVVNVVSYYKRDIMSSETEFECHAGAAAHVMLKGDFVKLAAE